VERVNYTILGATGFVGRHLVSQLRDAGHNVFAPNRVSSDLYVPSLQAQALGNVIYCIGKTADFRQRPLETVHAHVCLLRHVLETCEFDSLTYLSSTRVYRGAGLTREDATLCVSPSNTDDLYNISKLMGESICLSSSRSCRVARLSNVYGADIGSENFLSSVLREAVATGRVILHTSADSAKDYVAIEDVVRWLAMISAYGKCKMYNLAAGQNTSHASLASCLRVLGVEVTFTHDAAIVKFPRIDISCVTDEFGAPQHNILDDFSRLMDSYRRN
jgi:nucleoside-diphosphate-sugar epimerase